MWQVILVVTNIRVTSGRCEIVWVSCGTTLIPSDTSEPHHELRATSELVDIVTGLITTSEPHHLLSATSELFSEP